MCHREHREHRDIKNFHLFSVNSVAKKNYNMRICYFGTYERDYPRNKIFIDGLRKLGINVIECHEPIWELTKDKTGGYLKLFSLLKLGIRVMYLYLKLFLRYITKANNSDVVIVGYIGQLDIFLARMLTLFPKKRTLVFNPLISIYDTLINDRKIFKPKSLFGRIIYLIDKWSCSLSDIIILDTQSHIDYFVKTFNLPPKKFKRIFVGADEEFFNFTIDESNRQLEVELPINKAKPDKFKVQFIGKFIPLHGLHYIIKSAKLLENEKDIHFEIIGSGQLSNEIAKLTDELKLSNITFIDWIDYSKLKDKIMEADVCLGIFGDSEKAKRVIPNKVFQTLAMGKPLITGDSQGSRELLTDRENCILCEMANPDAIKSAILLLKNDEQLRKKIAENGYKLFKEKLSSEALARELFLFLPQSHRDTEKKNNINTQ